MHNTAFPRLILAAALLSWGLAYGWSQEFNPFSSKDDVKKYVQPPKGCGLSILGSSGQGKTYIYKAPRDNFKEPIRIKFDPAKDGTKRPDILVWADEIQWHDDVKSGTASGRIVVDDQKDYRVETTYVEYSQLARQLHCPRQTKIIQKNTDGTTSHMTASSVLVDFDPNGGIRSVKFDSIQEMNVEVSQDGNNPFKVDKSSSKPKSKSSATKKSGSTESAEKVISMDERKMKKMEGVAE